MLSEEEDKSHGGREREILKSFVLIIMRACAQALGIEHFSKSISIICFVQIYHREAPGKLPVCHFLAPVLSRCRPEVTV